MAMVGCCFRTEEASSIESFGSYSLFDLTFGHKGKKTNFVSTPIALFFFKGLKGLLRNNLVTFLNVSC